MRIKNLGLLGSLIHTLVCTLRQHFPQIGMSYTVIFEKYVVQEANVFHENV